MNKTIIAALLTGITLGFAADASAADLKIAMKSAVDSADPHQLFTPNRNIDLQVYEPLIYQDMNLKPVPWLATSWKNTDDVTWEIKLRDNVKFANGKPFTSADVVFSLNRGMTLEGTRTYRAYLKDIASVEAIDKLTVRIKTKQPSSLLPWNLTSIGMVSAEDAKDATAEDFNGGRAAVGTGPYKWIKWTPGQNVILEKNPTYWGGTEPWDKVTVRFISNDSARVAALLAGDVDVIDEVPGNLSKQVSTSGKTALVEDTSVFNVYLTADRFRAVTPFAKANDGSDLKENPFKNAEVRQAMNIAINRTGLAERIMQGAATPTGQISPENFAGYDASYKVPTYDAAAAKKLLAEAGYPEGFQLTIHCFNDRFSGDSQVCQALGTMFTAIGIRTKVETMPATVFYKRASTGGPNDTPEFSLIMAVYGTPTGNPINLLINIVQSFDKSKGLGVSNRGLYSNAEVDKLIVASQNTFEEKASEQKLVEATRLALNDGAITPLFFLKSSWGTRANLTLEPRGDGFTMLRNIRAKN